jgi:hypothetical protein
VPAGQISMLHELNHQLRVIMLDKPLRKYDEVANFTTFNGYSVGHWEGLTLVVESIGFNEDTFLDSTGLPHSDEMVTTERIRKIGNLSRTSSRFAIRSASRAIGRRASSTPYAAASASRITPAAHDASTSPVLKA